MRIWVMALGAMLLGLAACQREDAAERVVRIGSFPNITHVQALVARNMSREGKGWFERYLPGYTVQWQTYNAGPSAAEAIFGRTTDLTYIGPSPAINAYSVSSGREMRLLTGAVNGGAGANHTARGDHITGANHTARGKSCRAGGIISRKTISRGGSHVANERKNESGGADRVKK